MSKLKIPNRVSRVEIVSRSKDEAKTQTPFLELWRLRVVNKYSDGTQSPVYSYDGVTRKWIDAVVIALTSEIDGALAVCLRSCVRPPILLRREMATPMPEEKPFETLWELPAGLIEEGERGEQGIIGRAVRETLEETGYRLASDRFTIMPGAPFVSPGVIPERIYFVRAHIDDPLDRVAPQGDGSPAEDGAGIWWIAVDEAIGLCESGEIADLKTELGLRRLAAGRQ